MWLDDTANCDTASWHGDRATIAPVSALMPLTGGTRIGVYAIESVIGEGGMGIVYRAHDTKLKRAVAIKVLSDELANAGARRRFQREAQTASSLNHPHIVAVHDAGEFDGRQYLVTELVDGGTLRDWMRDPRHGWRQSLELVLGVADALATAHQAGILHRDIKPENILITKSGYAKLADFGLAKFQEDVPLDAATRTDEGPRTRPGAVLGTIAYMSPEQAAGERLDARSDIFSFGVVLYELISGRRPLAGRTDADVLHAIMHDAPAPLPDATPLDPTVAKAMERDPADRYQSMRDLVVDLRRALRQSADGGVSSHGSAWRWAAAAALVAAIAAGGWYALRPLATPMVREYQQLTNLTDSATSPVVSPDGRVLALVRTPSPFSGTPAELFVKRLPDGELVQLTNDGMMKANPKFSPDGSRIAYTTTADSKLLDTWIVPVDGGTPRPLVTNASGLTWIDGASNVGGQEQILFSEFTGRGFQMSIVASAESGVSRRTVYLPADGMAHRSYLSPDRQWVLVIEMDARSWLPCRLVPFDGSSPGRPVGPSRALCTNAAWSPDGRWMYFSSDTGSGFHTWRQRFPDGQPEQVTFGVAEEDEIHFDADGRSFVAAMGTRQSTIWIHDARGDRQLTSEGFAFFPTISPDAKTAYYLVKSGRSPAFLTGTLWSADLSSGRRRRWLPDFQLMHYTIAADGRRVLFVAVDERRRSSIWLAALNGTTAPRQVTALDSLLAFFASPGEVVFADASFIYRIKEDGTDLRKVSLIPTLLPFAVSPGGEWIPAAEGPSPESRNVLAVYSTRGGEPKVICRCYPPPNIDDGPMPPPMRWAPDGRFLYLRFDAATYAIPLRPGELLPAMPPRGFSSRAAVAAVPGARLLSEDSIFPGPDPSVYAFMKVTAHRNIYRVPVP